MHYWPLKNLAANGTSRFDRTIGLGSHFISSGLWPIVGDINAVVNHKTVVSSDACIEMENYIYNKALGAIQVYIRASLPVLLCFSFHGDRICILNSWNFIYVIYIYAYFPTDYWLHIAKGFCWWYDRLPAMVIVYKIVVCLKHALFDFPSQKNENAMFRNSKLPRNREIIRSS